MGIKFKVFATVIVLSLIFPFNVYADIKSIFYYDVNEEGENILKCKEYEFCGNFKNSEKAIILLENLFNNNEIMINYIPYGSKILDITLVEDTLFLNLSKEVLSYGGGSNYEYCFVSQIAKTVFEIQGIEFINILVEGKVLNFPEGIKNQNITRDNF